MTTVTRITEEFSNSPLRMPYALAVLACGHVASVDLRPAKGTCVKCGVRAEAPHAHTFAPCPCGAWSYTNLDYPKPHVEADRLTKIGQAVDCKECKAEAEQLAMIEALPAGAVHHTRIRFGGLHLYRLDGSSPSGFMLLASVAPTPANEAALARKRICQLSPTEPA